MTIVHLLTLLVSLFNHAGAHHVYGTKQSGNGLVATHNWLLIACKIPAHAHNVVFHCSGWVKR